MRSRRKWAPYLFLLPNMVIFGLFTIYPAFNGFNLSFYDSSNGLDFRAVGTGNYHRVLTDSEFWGVAKQTAGFVVGFVAVSTVLATALAMLLHRQRRGRGALSAAYFLPVVVSPVVVGLIWNAALDRRTGLVNQVVSALGFGHPGWLADSKLSLISVIMVGVWIHLGFYTMIVLAGLQGVDESIYEAATIDGAGTWQTIRHMTLPLLRPTTIAVVTLATITGFQAFDFIFTLTGGGPAGATTLLVQYVYTNAFRSPISYGVASASAVILFLVVFAVTFLNYMVGRRRESI